MPEISGEQLAAQIYKFNETFTDAQIKAMPTTALTLVAALGANQIIQLLGPIALVSNIAVAYANIHAAGAAILHYGPPNNAEIGYLPNDAGAGLSLLTTLLTLTEFMLLPQYLEYVAGWGNTYPAFVPNDIKGTPLLLKVDNSGAGAFTGGDAANELSVSGYYTIIDV